MVARGRVTESHIGNAPCGIAKYPNAPGRGNLCVRRLCCCISAATYKFTCNLKLRNEVV